MADVKSYTEQIAQAAYGREVRSAIVDAINAVSDENNTYNQIKMDIQSLHNQAEASYTGNQVIQGEISTAAEEIRTISSGLTDKLEKGKTLNTDLSERINSGTTLNNNLVYNVDEAKSVNQSLGGNVSAAQNFNQKFDEMVKSAEVVEQSLTADVESGTQLLPDLREAVTNAAIAKNELDGVIAGTADQFNGKVDKEEGKGLSSNDYTDDDKRKLAGVSEGANYYMHPAHEPHAAGLYKLAVDESGHVSAAHGATLEDFTAIGLPERDTTYEAASAAADGLMSAADKEKLDTVEQGANHTVVDTSMDASSGNPVQNGVITAKIKNLEASITSLANSVEQNKNGLIEMPGGLMIQWGSKNVPSVAAKGITKSSVAYPKSFSSTPIVFCNALANYHISAIPESNGNLKGFNANLRAVDGIARTNRWFNWIAIGFK